MASSERHWVEELFPPVYTLSIEDLLEEEEEKPASVYELAARRISKFDPETIKNVFERVWLMKTVEEQQRQQQEQGLDTRSHLGDQETTVKTLQESGAPSSFNLGTAPNRLEQIILEALRESQDKWETEAVDVSDSKLWTSNEIKEIRKVYSAARKDNIKLRAALEDAESRIKKLEHKCRRQFALFDQKEGALVETQKANKRLQILGKTLKTNLDQVEQDNDSLEEEVKELREQNSELVREMSEARTELETERIRRQNAEIDVEDIRKAVLREAELQIERIDIKYEKQIHKLLTEIEEVKVELNKERKDHSRTRKGLEHLQKHFSSLPYKDQESKKAMVTRDQLIVWTS